MGLLVDGRWQDRWYDTGKHGGRFEREATKFHDRIVPADSAGAPGSFAAEPDRYHLYVSYACPWAHRALIFRKLKGLEQIISLSVVHWHMGENGWTFRPGPGVTGDAIHGAKYLYEVYLAADPRYTGRVTVPVLWDKRRQTIVNNESAEIIRMLNDAFDDVGARPGDYYPAGLRDEIDAINGRVYETVNNGVYKAGFATTQHAYEEAVEPLFDTLNWLDDRLGDRRYLLGGRLTEADWRLFTTLLRFDVVYYGHFKCNRRRIVDYPQLSGYLRDLYQQPGISETTRFDHIKRHYYTSHKEINPTRIVPIGPDLDLDAPHGRDGLSG